MRAARQKRRFLAFTGKLRGLKSEMPARYGALAQAAIRGTAEPLYLEQWGCPYRARRPPVSRKFGG